MILRRHVLAHPVLGVRIELAFCEQDGNYLIRHRRESGKDESPEVNWTTISCDSKASGSARFDEMRAELISSGYVIEGVISEEEERLVPLFRHLRKDSGEEWHFELHNPGDGPDYHVLCYNERGQGGGNRKFPGYMEAREFFDILGEEKWRKGYREIVEDDRKVLLSRDLIKGERECHIKVVEDKAVFKVEMRFGLKDKLILTPVGRASNRIEAFDIFGRIYDRKIGQGYVIGEVAIESSNLGVLPGVRKIRWRD